MIDGICPIPNSIFYSTRQTGQWAVAVGTGHTYYYKYIALSKWISKFKLQITHVPHSICQFVRMGRGTNETNDTQIGNKFWFYAVPVNKAGTLKINISCCC